MLNVRMQQAEVQKLSPKITVVGVGGAGGNAVNNMIDSGLQGCEFLVCNTDAQALEGSHCESRLQLGVTVTGGLGAGAKPEVGREAAEESLDQILQHMEGANMAFITAGMGGGTGTGAAPVIARAAREKGILTVGVVTKPFHFEGTHRMKMAEQGIEEMQDYVDTLIVIPNQNLFRIANEKTTFAEAFRMADGVLQSGVRGVTDLMVMPGLINLDFADIRSAMLEMGKAMMGTGEASGDKRAIEAAEKAISNPLLDDVTMKGARGVIINVTGGMDMTLFEVDEACNRIRDEVDPEANIIFGSTFDEGLEGVMRVSVVATGIDAVASAGTGQNTSGGFTAQTQGHALKGIEPKKESTSSIPAAAPAKPTSTESQAEQKQEALPNMFHGPKAEESESASSAQIPSAPRSAVEENAFIPPRPVEPAQVQAPATAQTPVTPTTSPATPAAPLQATRPGGSGVVLTPPVPGAGAREKKKTPSIFERFTRPLVSDETEGGKDGETTTGTGGLQPSPPADKPATQGNLGVNAPATPKAAESGGGAASSDDLDIPAFLRRQVS